VAIVRAHSAIGSRQPSRTRLSSDLSTAPRCFSGRPASAISTACRWPSANITASPCRAATSGDPCVFPPPQKSGKPTRRRTTAARQTDELRLPPRFVGATPCRPYAQVFAEDSALEPAGGLASQNAPVSTALRRTRHHRLAPCRRRHPAAARSRNDEVMIFLATNSVPGRSASSEAMTSQAKTSQSMTIRSNRLEHRNAARARRARSSSRPTAGPLPAPARVRPVVQRVPHRRHLHTVASASLGAHRALKEIAAAYRCSD